MKYQPDYPGRFRDIWYARHWLADFFAWYNDHHHHSGLALFTPADVYFGRVDDIAQRRQEALDDAHCQHPERFVSGPPRVPRSPQRVELNPIEPGREPVTADIMLATPTSTACGRFPSRRACPVMALPGVETSHHPTRNT